MTRIVRLNESDLSRIVNRIIEEEKNHELIYHRDIPDNLINFNSQDMSDIKEFADNTINSEYITITKEDASSIREFPRVTVELELGGRYGSTEIILYLLKDEDGRYYGTLKSYDYKGTNIHGHFTTEDLKYLSEVDFIMDTFSREYMR